MSLKMFSFLATALLFCAPLLAQGPPPPAIPQVQARMARRGVEPCWQQAGIAKSVMEQRRILERETRAQVEAVCADSSLTPQQKQQQVREIRQQAGQKMEGLITASQKEALTTCQKERAMNHPGSGGGGHEHGGCGEWPHDAARPNGAPGGSGGTGTPPPQSPPPQN